MRPGASEVAALLIHRPQVVDLGMDAATVAVVKHKPTDELVSSVMVEVGSSNRLWIYPSCRVKGLRRGL